MMRMYTENEVLRALKKSWSIHPSSKWSKDNPARGHCGVTTLVVNDILGGKIYKTWLDEGWHFYNILNGERKDFTQEQFTYNPEYHDVRSNREEAFQDTNDIQYSYLKSQVYVYLRKS
ncbi:YunG family protein [Lysinibacillus sp. NPDC093692]|uniref:YunG family protein n=1 Tax=Lysinibacillus sp. NPDC093692 TaxID=3390578 RepID=UPI003D02A1BD